MKSDVISAGRGSSRSGYQCEIKVSLWGMLTLNAFTGAFLQQAKYQTHWISASCVNSVHVGELCICQKNINSNSLIRHYALFHSCRISGFRLSVSCRQGQVKRLRGPGAKISCGPRIKNVHRFSLSSVKHSAKRKCLLSMGFVTPAVFPILTSFWDDDVLSVGTTVPIMLQSMLARSIMLPWSQWVNCELCFSSRYLFTVWCLHHAAQTTSYCLLCSHGNRHHF